MLNILFWVAVGAFVGWNLPQPPWAKFVQGKLVDIFQKLKDSLSKPKTDA